MSGVSAAKPRRVLHFLSWMKQSGGTENFVMNLYRNIDRSRVQFDFALYKGARCDYAEEIRALGGRVLAYPAPRMSALPACLRSIGLLLDSEGPFAAVHSHSFLFSGFVLRMAAAKGVPIRIAHSHLAGDEHIPGPLRWGFRWYMRRLLRSHATHMFACSRPAAQALFGRACWSDPRVRIIPNAIDLSRFAVGAQARNRIRNALALSPETPLFAYVGRLVRRKRLPFLLGLFAAVVRQLPAAHLVVVGDGPLFDTMERRSRRMGLAQCVHFLGLRRDVPELMKGADVLLLPSLLEGLPVVVVEAQAAGLPCVVADSVAQEADLGLGLVQFAPADGGTVAWAQAAVAALRVPRADPAAIHRVFADKGYDIGIASRTAEEIYLGETGDPPRPPAGDL